MTTKKTSPHSPRRPPPAGTGGASGQQGYLLGRNGAQENRALSEAQLQAKLRGVAARGRTVVGPGAGASGGATEATLRAPLPEEARATTPPRPKRGATGGREA